MRPMLWFIVLGIVVSVVTFIVWAANSRWAADRDWFYNKHHPRPRGGGTLGLFEQVFQPSIEHVIEERSSEHRRGNQDESGDKPDAASETTVA
jgi:hypothetical protein